MRERKKKVEEYVTLIFIVYICTLILEPNLDGSIKERRIQTLLNLVQINKQRSHKFIEEGFLVYKRHKPSRFFLITMATKIRHRMHVHPYYNFHTNFGRIRSIVYHCPIKL